MTDVPDGSGQIRRRAPRVGDGAAPVSGGLAIALAIVAVVAGFLILRSISDSGETSADFPPTADGAAGGSDGAVTTTTGVSDTGPTLPTTTTTTPIVTEGASVIVANANGLGGTAGAMTRAIRDGAGFDVVDPTDASSTIGELEDSVIYFDASVPAAQTVAESLARVLGDVGSISPMPETPPTDDGSLNGAQVLLMLGLDKANQTLEELNPDLAAGDEVVTVTSPEPSGTTTTTAADG